MPSSGFNLFRMFISEYFVCTNKCILLTYEYWHLLVQRLFKYRIVATVFPQQYLFLFVANFFLHNPLQS
jgi:hypothetical protein